MKDGQRQSAPLLLCFDMWEMAWGQLHCENSRTSYRKRITASNFVPGLLASLLQFSHCSPGLVKAIWQRTEALHFFLEGSLKRLPGT